MDTVIVENKENEKLDGNHEEKNVMLATKDVKLIFLRNVFGLLSLQILITVIITILLKLTPIVHEYIQSNVWIVIIFIILYGGAMIVLHFKKKQFPMNFYLFGSFTIIQAYTIGILITYSSEVALMQALLLLLDVFVGLTLFTFQNKVEYSLLGTILIAGIGIGIVGGISLSFLNSTTFRIAIALGGALFISLFTIIYVHIMMNALSPEDHIIASINLSLGIFYLFAEILKFFQRHNLL